MKYIRKTKNINESFKKISELKKNVDKSLTDEELYRSACTILYNDFKPHVEKILVKYFVNKKWWSLSSLSKSTNLRPGEQCESDYEDNLTDYEDKLEYLYSTVPCEMHVENRTFYITIPLTIRNIGVGISNSDATLEITDNYFFDYLYKLNNEFSNFEIPVVIKYKIDVNYINSNYKINQLALWENVNFDKVINFFKNDVVNIDDFNQNIELGIYNNIYNSSFVLLYPLGDIIKFKNVNINLSVLYREICKNNNELPALVTLDGIENLLNSPNSKIYVSKIYFNNNEFTNYCQEHSKLRSKIISSY